MKQLPLNLSLPTPLTFDDFLIGPNLEVFEQLKCLALGSLNECALYLWGDIGVGKTHLLLATVALACENGRCVHYCNVAQTALTDVMGDCDLLVIDHVDQLASSEQTQLFALYNSQRDSGRSFLAAGAVAPGKLALREDLKTRLGWGLIYHVLAPADDDKAALLRHRARSRGYEIGEDVCRYLVTHAKRDLGSLTALLDWLDREALASQRLLTLPFVRDALKRFYVLPTL